MKNIEEQSGQFQITSESKTTAERYVVFLDIMGFKDRVARNTHQDLLEQLEDFNKSISINCENDEDIQLAQFSDSIVLFSNEADSKSLQSIAKVAAGIMYTAIVEKQIPLKGAIAKGVVTCDLSKQLFFGQALIDAYLLEENVNYYGILVHHSAEQNAGEMAGLFKDIKAPLKSGKISHYELLWYKTCLAEKDTDTGKIKKALREIRRTVSDAPRKYIDNTLDIIADA